MNAISGADSKEQSTLTVCLNMPYVELILFRINDLVPVLVLHVTESPTTQ